MRPFFHILILFLTILIVSCEGPEGPQGPAGPSGSIDNYPPYVPSNPQPPDGHDDRLGDIKIHLIDGKILLSCTTGDQDNDDLRYDLYYGVQVPPPIVGENIEQPYYLVETSPPYGQRVWRVVVKDGVNDPVEGPLWRFYY